MYVLYKSKNILTLVTIGYIVGFIVGMYNEYCVWAQVAVLNHKLLYWIVWDRFIQVLYLGRAPRTKETLPDFREKCRVTRHSRVFLGLTGSQQTPGIGASQLRIKATILNRVSKEATEAVSSVERLTEECHGLRRDLQK